MLSRHYSTSAQNNHCFKCWQRSPFSAICLEVHCFRALSWQLFPFPWFSTPLLDNGQHPRQSKMHFSIQAPQTVSQLDFFSLQFSIFIFLSKIANKEKHIPCKTKLLYIDAMRKKNTQDHHSPTSLPRFDLITSSLSAHRQPVSLRMTAIITISGRPCLRWL